MTIIINFDINKQLIKCRSNWSAEVVLNTARGTSSKSTVTNFCYLLKIYNNCLMYVDKDIDQSDKFGKYEINRDCVQVPL